MEIKIRKLITITEETLIEGEKKLDKPVHKAAAIAVIKNPFADKYDQELNELMDTGEQMGELLSPMAVKALGVEGGKVESYGKAAIVGEKGELEHAGAILHPKLGKGLRATVVEGKAIIPSAKKMGGVGTSLDVPLHYKNSTAVCTHYDSFEVRIPDAPRTDEILVAIAVTDSGRPLARIPGTRKEDVE